MPNYLTPIMRILLIAIISFLFSCSDNHSIEKKDIVLTINDFKMSRSEFKTQFAADMEYNENFKESASVRQEALDGIIRKELLIQEAKKMGLDRDAKFMAAIERYWEATLIKQLMEKKNSEIRDTTKVSEQEIEKKYQEYKLQNKAMQPLKTIEKEIFTEILETKTQASFETWVDSLHKNAKIKIDDQIFTQ